MLIDSSSNINLGDKNRLDYKKPGIRPPQGEEMKNGVVKGGQVPQPTNPGGTWLGEGWCELWEMLVIGMCV